MDYYYGTPEKDCFPSKNEKNAAASANPPSTPSSQSDGIAPPTPGIINREGQFQSPLIQPSFDSEEMQGSMQQILAQNVGEYVVIEFLIGTERLMRKQGILYFVGRSYVTLYDDMQRDYIVCDLFSIKFVYFYYPGVRPRRNYNILPNGSSANGNGR